ncbi:MAG: hypothetical protein GOVbin3107_23 [Prokaryotic dsDNA virus sp.]|nr:MAG: hypothetical protein GOVbin3107_23 [Prokaryotic dsDNA virus sp.]|tara:strand:- start:24570 stop:31721 length:7152 start_codon:yes stop_codon:yes gene_type:complete
MSNQEIYEELKSIGVLKDKTFNKFQEDMKDESYKSKVQDVLGVDLQKKKDSTSISPEESMESTTVENQAPISSESSQTQVTEKVEQQSSEVEQPTEDDDSEPKTPPTSTTEVDDSWKVKYKEITGLNPDEEGVTYEQAKQGFIPNNPTSVKFRGQNFKTGSISWNSQSLGQKLSSRRYAKKYGVEDLFGKNGIYWEKGYNDAKASLELEMPEFEPEKEVVEAEVIDSSTMLDEVEVTTVSLEEATQPTDFEKLDDDSKDLVVSNITTSNPDLDPEKIEVVSVEKYTQETKPVEVADELIDEIDVVSGEQKTKAQKIQELEGEIQKIEEDNKAAEELPANLEDQKKQTLQVNKELKQQKEDQISELKQDVARQETTSEYKAKIIYDGKEMEVNAGTTTTLPEFEVVAPSKETEKVFEKQEEQFQESQYNILADEVASKIGKYSTGEESDLPSKQRVKAKIKEIVSLQDSPYDPPVEILDNEGIGREVITSEEEYSERFINDVFNEYGIEASQDEEIIPGVDRIKLRAVDENGNVTAETTIDLDIARTDLDLDLKPITGGGEGDLAIQILDPEEQRKKIQAERKKLKNFIKENARPKKVETEKDVKLSDPAELNAARKERNELLVELQKVKNATIESMLEAAMEVDELLDILSDEDSTFEEVQQAQEEYSIATKKLSDLRDDIIVKIRVIDELNDLIIESETESYKNIKEFGVPEGDVDYSLWSYSWDIFLNSFKDSIFGTFQAALELLRLPFGGLSKKDREFLRDDFDNLFSGLDADITDLEKAKANYNAGWWQKFGTVLLELLGNAAAALTLGGGSGSVGSVLMKLLPVESAGMVYERTSQRMDEDPIFDKIPEWQKTLLKDSIALVIYFLDKLGLKLSVGQLNRILIRLIEEYSKKASKSSSKGGFIKYVIDQLADPNKVVRLVEKSAIAGSGEGSTEIMQGLGEKALKDLFNLTQDEDVFKPSEVIVGNEDLIAQSMEEGSLGFAAGALLGPLAPGDINALNDEDISRAIITLDKNSNENLIANLKVKIAEGKMTADDASAIINFNEQVQQIVNKYKDLPDLTKDELFELVKKDALLQDLEQQFNQGGTVAQKILGPRIDKLKAEMDAIAENAVKRSEGKQIEEAEITPEPEIVTEPAPEPTEENDIIEARKIASFAISRDNNLTLEELSQVAELMPDLDIDISTDRDIKADELLTKINDYAVQRETADSVQDTREEGPESRPEGEMEVPQQQEEVQDEKQVDEDKPEDEGPDEPQIEVAGVTLEDVKRILGEDPSTEDVFFEGKGIKNKITKIKRHVFSRRKFLPKIWSNLVDQRDNQQAADLFRAEKLLQRYNDKLKKLPKSQQEVINKIGGLYLSGGLPKSFLDGEISRDEAITEVENQIADLNLQLEQTDNESEQRKIKDQINNGIDFLFFLSDMDAALSEEGGQLVPDDVIDIITEMRDMIDDFSKSLISDPDVEISENKAQTIEENLGEYVNRNYQVYNDADWKNKVSEEVKQNAEKFFFDQYMKSFNQQQEMLEIGPEGGTFTDPITGEKVTVKAESKEELENKLRKRAKNKVISILSKEGATQVLTISDSKGILKERKDIPIEIRMLMGEYGDTGSKFVTTVTKQSSVLRNAQMRGRFIKTGLDNGFIFKTEEEALDNSEGDQQYNAKITIGDKTYYTAPSVASAYNQMNNAQKSYDFLINTWLKAASAVKWGKTIGSPATQSVNFLSNTGFAAVNGHLLAPGAGKEARQTSLSELFSFWTDPNTKKEQQEKYARYIELGIVNQNVGLNDIKEFAKRGEEKWLEDQLKTNSSWRQAFQWAGKGAEKLYETGDNFWKIKGFEVEKNRYADALYGKPFEELTEAEKKDVEERAAEIIKNVYPNYSKLPEYVNEKRRSSLGPAFSSFIAFQYESYRTMFETLALAKEEMKNPKLRGVAGRRIAGALSYYAAKQTILGTLASSAGFAIGGLAGTLTGVDDEESEELSKLRDRYLPEWSKGKGSAIFTIKNQDGTYSYIDLSQMDPHQNIEKISMAFTESENIADFMIKVVSEGLIKPFASGDIVAQWASDLATNKDFLIYNPTDPFQVILSDVLSYTSKKLAPGIYSTAEKLMKDPGKGLLSFSGARPYDIDIPRAFNRKVQALRYGDIEYLIKDGLNDAIRDYARDAKVDLKFLDENFDQRSQTPLSLEGEEIDVMLDPLTKSIFGGLTLSEYYDKQNERYKEYINEAHLDYKAAIEVYGMDEKDLQKIMKDEGMRDEEILQIMNNTPKDIETKYGKLIKAEKIASLKRKIQKDKEKLKAGGMSIQSTNKLKDQIEQNERRFDVMTGKTQKENLKERLSQRPDLRINENDSQEVKAEKRRKLNEEIEKRMQIGYSQEGLYPKIKQFNGVVDMLLQE